MVVVSIIDYSRTSLNNIIWGLWGCEYYQDIVVDWSRLFTLMMDK